MSCRQAGQDARTSSGGAAAAPRPSVAEVLRAALAARPAGLSPHHWKTLDALIACRTPRLGGHLYRCEDCGHEHFVPHSCVARQANPGRFYHDKSGGFHAVFGVSAAMAAVGW